MLAGPRTFSQLAASFFAAGSLGIPRPPLVTSSRGSNDFRLCLREIVLIKRPISYASLFDLVCLSLIIVNELNPERFFRPFFLKRAAKIRTFSLPPNFSATFFTFFQDFFCRYFVIH